MTCGLLAALLGVPLLMVAIMLIFQPEQSLNIIGMPLMEGAGMSFQLGGLISFFLCTAIILFPLCLGEECLMALSSVDIPQCGRRVQKPCLGCSWSGVCDGRNNCRDCYDGLSFTFS